MLTEGDVRLRRVGGAIAIAMGVILLVLAVMAMTGSLGAVAASKTTSGETASGETTSAGASSESASTSTQSSESANTTAPLTVLNASGTAGLAGQGKTAFESKGWQVTQTGNLSGAGVPTTSTVYYPENDEPAHVAAQSLVKEFPQLVAEKAPAGLAYPGVVVVLTGEWTPGQ